MRYKSEPCRMSKLVDRLREMIAVATGKGASGQECSPQEENADPERYYLQGTADGVAATLLPDYTTVLRMENTELKARLKHYQGLLREDEVKIRELSTEVKELNLEVTDLKKRLSSQRGQLLKAAARLTRTLSPRRDLDSPVLDLDLSVVNRDIRDVSALALLPSGGALIAGLKKTVSRRGVVWKVDETGTVCGPSFFCKTQGQINSLVLQEGYVFVLQSSGQINRCSVQDLSRRARTWTADVKQLTGGAALDEQRLLIVDADRGHMILFNLETEQQEAVVTDLKEPAGVTIHGKGRDMNIFVPDIGLSEVRVYDRDFHLKHRIAGPGDINQGALQIPTCVTCNPEGKAFVADSANNRVVEVTPTGKFLRTWLTRADGVERPEQLAVSDVHLWVVCYLDFSYVVKRYRLFKEVPNKAKPKRHGVEFARPDT